MMEPGKTESEKVECMADLVSIGNGAAVEKFSAEIEKVIQNIRDPNTKAEARRKVILEFVFEPKEDREVVAVTITAKSTLPASKPSGDVMWVGSSKGGKLVATVMHTPNADPRQGVLSLTKEKDGKSA